MFDLACRLKRLLLCVTALRPTPARRLRALLCNTAEGSWPGRARAQRATDRSRLRLLQAQLRLQAHHGFDPPAMPQDAGAPPTPRLHGTDATSRLIDWTAQAPRSRRNTWSCSCGFIANFAIRTTCYRCDRPRPRFANFGAAAVVPTMGKEKGRHGLPPLRAPWSTTVTPTLRLTPPRPSHLSRPSSGSLPPSGPCRLASARPWA